MREAAIMPVSLRKHLILPLGALLACSLLAIAIVHFQFKQLSARARTITEITHPQKRAVAAMESDALRVVTAALAYTQHHDPQQLTELGKSAAQFRRAAELFRTNGNGDAALGKELTTVFDELQTHANALIDHENQQTEKTAALRKMVAELDRLLASAPLRAGDALQAAAVAQMRQTNDGMRTSVSILLGSEDATANVLQMQAESFASVVGAYRKRASQAHERAWATELEKILTALVAIGQELKGHLTARAADWNRLLESRRQLEQRIHTEQKLAEEKALAQSRSVQSTLSWTRWLLILMACASLACGFATVLVATRSLARPISHLIEVARAITHGRTRHRASPDAAGEFSLLADAFNQMIEARQQAEEKLQLAHDSLELKVQARTIELWRANKALREETEQRAHAEREFQQAQKMDALGKLAGSIAHDFNNLLTVIIGGAECAQNQLQPSHPAISLLQTVQQAGERAAGLTRPLLTFSRNQVLALEPLSLNEAAEEASRMLQRLMGVNIEVRLSLDPELRRVCANANQMQQVLINLAVNGRDAMEGMGVLTITTRNATVDPTVARRNGLAAAEHWVEISVSDTGCGMDATTKARIFEPFFTTKPAGRGTGLGLSTVFGIVKQTGGLLNVESKVGEGTTFRIYLPATNAVKQQQEDEEINNPPQLPKVANGGDETLLLVDDEQEIRELATMTLEGRGYRVLAAGNSEEAILLGEKHAGEIRALITDVVMPGINGAQLASVLTKIIPNLRVLFVSGHSNESISAQTLLETRADYLQKPYLGETLATKVREILSRNEPRLSDPPGKERFTAWMN